MVGAVIGGLLILALLGWYWFVLDRMSRELATATEQLEQVRDELSRLQRLVTDVARQNSVSAGEVEQQSSKCAGQVGTDLGSGEGSGGTVMNGVEASSASETSASETSASETSASETSGREASAAELSRQAAHEQLVGCAIESSVIPSAEPRLALSVTNGLAHGRLEELYCSLWPREFLTGRLQDWQQQICNKLDQPDSAARLLMLALAKYRACAVRKDDDELAKSLHETGRWAYQFWDESGISAEAQSAAAELWAECLNLELAGRLRLRTVAAGEPKDQYWMNYGMGSGSAPVVKVRNWCVQDDAGRPLEKAQVT